eukprot:CAMPEP_0115890410 /NCGR_PEP_ID=MMETSP0287-20121206/33339_1 /TAXON_ID=412157 /ORGANISM="Chrysochromulina rotalis, Strain UIO044" /LENGTH=123 /DNA_ID=CAMNT_0003347185 /DNA_START=9 /DNA_END=380 /DNA_ORIENTATION=-
MSSMHVRPTWAASAMLGCTSSRVPMQLSSIVSKVMQAWAMCGATCMMAFLMTQSTALAPLFVFEKNVAARIRNGEVVLSFDQKTSTLKMRFNRASKLRPNLFGTGNASTAGASQGVAPRQPVM